MELLSIVIVVMSFVAYLFFDKRSARMIEERRSDDDLKSKLEQLRLDLEYKKAVLDEQKAQREFHQRTWEHSVENEQKDVAAQRDVVGNRVARLGLLE